ncbi:MAG: GNAT family N-acetyltransferase, partial [Acidimicrobiales bacterium]
MTSDGPAIGFRPLGRDDFAQLARWFSEPQVDRWWNEDSSPGGIEAKYGRRVDGLDATSMWVIEIDG